MKNRFFVIVAILGLAAPICTCCAAEDSPASTDESEYLPWEKGSVQLGGFATFFNSTVSFGLNNRPGVSINAEDRLGLDSSLTVFRAEVMYRPGESKRNQLDLYYANYDRTGDATLSRDLTIRDVTYTVGAKVHSELNFSIIRGTYSYAFLQNERVRLALGLGLYAIPLKYGLNVETSSGRSAVEGADVTFPLPAIALRAEWQLIPRLFLNADLEGMYIEIGGFSGSMLDATLTLEYRPWNHFGLGLGYGYMGVNVDAKSGHSDYPGANFVGSVDLHFNGLLVYGKFSF